MWSGEAGAADLPGLRLAESQAPTAPADRTTGRSTALGSLSDSAGLTVNTGSKAGLSAQNYTTAIQTAVVSVARPPPALSAKPGTPFGPLNLVGQGKRCTS